MKHLLFCFIMMSGFGAKAQFMEYGLGVGGSLYWGDLNAPDFGTNVGNTNLSFQGVVKLNFTKNIAAKANLLFGKLSGDDSKSYQEWQKQRNLNFTSSLIELSILGEWHLFGYNFGEENPISPYITAGIGAFYFNPLTELEGTSYALQPLGTEGQGLPGFAKKYNRISMSIPFGGGAKLKLNDNVNLAIDVLARRTFTDYIDDVSTNYVAYDELSAGNGEIAARLGNRIGEYLGQDEPVDVETGEQRGGAKIKDYFFTGMFTITFKINRNLKMFGKFKHRTDCPKF